MKNLIYQMLPRLWGNGKFSAVDAAFLAYLREELRVDTVWYTGVIRHATRKADGGCIPAKVVKGEAGSPYAIADYYDVNPYLAADPSQRMAEFEALVARTHAAGLKVLIDFVPNHVAREYDGAMTPAGETRLGAADNPSVHWSPENDFYYYPGAALRLPVDCGGYSEYPARASGNSFTPSPDVNDWYETVKINYGDSHTPTWDRMLRIVRFWAAKGVDGFRCDMVELVPPAFMQWLIASVKAEFPHVRFVAEVYETEKYPLYVNEVGFDLLYDKSGLYDRLRAVTCDGASARSLTGNWQMLGELQGRMLNFLENHDEQRVASDFFAGTAEKGYAALAVSLLQNDASFMLYFGQEIGERGMDDEPFSGVNGRTSIFDWWTVASLERLRKWIGNHRGGLTRAERDVLAHYRELLSLSRRPAFASGNSFDLCYCQGEGFDADRNYAFLRSDGKECWLVAAHFGDEPAGLTLRIPPEAGDYFGMQLPAGVPVEVPAWNAVTLKIAE